MGAVCSECVPWPGRSHRAKPHAPQGSKTKEQHMSTLKLTMIAAVVAALGLAAPLVAKAAADWRNETYCPQPAASSSSISLDTRLGTMDESDVCIYQGTIIYLR